MVTDQSFTTSAFLLPCLHHSLYNLTAQLVHVATQHVADTFFPSLALVFKLDEPTQVFLFLAFVFLITPDLLLPLCAMITNTFGMVSGTMELSQPESRAPLLPLSIAQIHKWSSAMNKE